MQPLYAEYIYHGGPAVNAIVTVAAEKQVDFIVLGVHRKRPVRRNRAAHSLRRDSAGKMPGAHYLPTSRKRELREATLQSAASR